MPAACAPTPELALQRRLLRFDDIDSTNSEAQRRFASGERGPLWIWSLAQSKGRGRVAGRAWVSPPGNLHSTYLVTVAAAARSLGQASFVAALAAVDAVAVLGSGRLPVALKWPNDVLVEGRKVSGILIESLGGGEVEGWTLAIGCGLNLAHAPDATRFPATALGAHGVAVTAEEAFAVYAGSLVRRLEQWQAGRNFAAIRQDWLALGPRIGSPLSVDSAGAPMHGCFAGLGDGGALRLALADGSIHEIHAGEVLP